MEVIVKNSFLVHPAEPTWSGCIPMSEFDQTGVLTDAQVIYFYRPSQDWLSPEDRIFKTIHDSLSKALVYYYPLAGRLHSLDGGRLQLDCNNKGVELIEAEAHGNLDDLGDFTMLPADMQTCLIHQIDYVSLAMEEVPLTCVQLTKFRCGGITLSFTMSHVAADGMAAVQFLNRLARLARGVPLGDAPCFETRLLRAGEPRRGPPRFPHPEFDPPPVLIGQADGTREKQRKTTDALLKLSRIQVEALKKEANKARPEKHSACRPYTRYESITAHIWRCSCKARRHVHEQPTVMAVPVDIRRRVEPPLPQTYFFNAVLQVITRSQSGEVITEPLGYVAGKIREAINSVTNEYVQSAIDNLKNLNDLSHLQDIHDMKTDEGDFFGNPSLGVTSWLGFPLQGLDFGWGREILMVPRTHDFDGDIVILPSADGDGSLFVSLCLQADFIEDFKKFFFDDIPSNDMD